MDLVKFEKVLSKAKLKTDINFLQDFYNHNFSLSTDKSRPINSAYKFQDELNLVITRRDYSNIYDIKESK